MTDTDKPDGLDEKNNKTPDVRVDGEEYKVLGDNNAKKKKKISHSLPEWIQKGICIENAGVEDDGSALDNIATLDDDIKRAVTELDGFTHLLPGICFCFIISLLFDDKFLL